MAHQQAGNTVVREQQEYAAKHDIPGVFESLTIALLYKKPADPITFISEEAKRMAASKTYSATSPGREADTQAEAIKYLDSHNIHAILEELFTGLLFSQPHEPLKFISTESERLHRERSQKQPSSPFTEADLRAMHSLFDPSGTGAISPAQISTAFQNLGLKQKPKLDASALGPKGVDADAFVALAKAAIAAEKVL